MTTNEIVGSLKAGGLDASSTNRSAAVYVTEARSGRAEPGWFGFRIVCDSEATERLVRAILSRWYDIDASGSVWRLRSKNRVPLMAIKRGGVPPTPPTPAGDYLYFESAQSNSTVSMISALATAPNLEYSTDGETWQEWQHTTADGTHNFDTLTLTAVGDRVYLRGDNPNGFADFANEKLSIFSMSGSVKGGGNIMSLLDKTMALTEVPDYGFFSLFCDLIGHSQNTALLTPPDMSFITKIGLYGCAYMYNGCTSLTHSADMPSLTYIGNYGCNLMYTYCLSLGSGADMPVVAYFGSRAISAMYADIGDVSILCDKDAGTQEVTSIKFEFPTLPITMGQETLTNYTDLINNMTER